MSMTRSREVLVSTRIMTLRAAVVLCEFILECIFQLFNTHLRYLFLHFSLIANRLALGSR
jgi:hypothetical protein